MRVVQTQVSDTEYSLLVAYARSRKSTIKEVVREAIRKVAIRDEVEPEGTLVALAWNTGTVHRAAWQARDEPPAAILGAP